MDLMRRRFLARVAAAGGASLVCETMTGLGPLAAPTQAPFAGDYMTDMSSWMQGAFESAREVAAAIHSRALTRI